AAKDLSARSTPRPHGGVRQTRLHPGAEGPLPARIAAVGKDSGLKEVYDTQRYLLYVACTRARDHLVMAEWSRRPSSWTYSRVDVRRGSSSFVGFVLLTVGGLSSTSKGEQPCPRP